MKNSIDWTEQWEQHAPNFEKREGCAYVDLGSYGKSAKDLRLLPGAGFGDCSHPTTRLILRLMSCHAQGASVIDVGCGSGILSLAALLWGATGAMGIDIDEEALEHARRNAQFNGFSHALFSTKLQPMAIDNSLIVINMISSEQKIAWQQNPELHNLRASILASGILASERERYIGEVQHQRGWQFLEEIQEGDWLAMRFLIV